MKSVLSQLLNLALATSWVLKGHLNVRILTSTILRQSFSELDKARNDRAEQDKTRNDIQNRTGQDRKGQNRK